MNCLELKVGDKTFTFKNNGKSEAYKASDWPIIKTFLSTGVMKGDWTCEVDGIELSSKDVYNIIIDNLNNIKSTDAIKYGESEDSFINNLVGTYNFSMVDEDNTDISPEKNVQVISSMDSGSNIYGVNSRRIVLLTGNKFWNRSKTNKIIYEIYNNLKSNNQNFVKKISQIYNNEYGEDDLDVYKKFQKLLNNNINLIYKSFYNPKNELYLEVKKSTDISDNIDNIVGKIIYVKENGKSKPFVIKRLKKHSSEIVGIVIDDENNTRENRIISYGDVKKIYNSYTINGKILIGKNWYNTDYSKVDNNEELNEIFFEAVQGRKIFKIPTKQTIESIESILSDIDENVGIETSEGYFTKDNLSSIHSDARVYAIYHNNILPSSLMPNEEFSFTLNNLKIYLNDKYGNIIDYIKFDYNKRNGYFHINHIQNSIPARYELVIHISSDMVFTDDYHYNLEIASNLVSYLNRKGNNTGLKPTGLLNLLFKKFNNNLIELSEEVNIIYNDIIENIREYNSNDIKESWESNYDKAKERLYISKEIDDVVSRAIEAGAYNYSCEV